MAMSYLPLPTRTEIATTRALIFSHKEVIRDVELMIKTLEGQIEALHASISRVQVDIAEKEAFIAPVRRLPFDILTEIIVTAATAPTADVRQLRTLASVCQSWRDATLRTPRAWSKIFVSSHSYDLRTVDEARVWFSRSGTCPKDVSMACVHMSTIDVHALYDLLFDHTADIRSIFISSGTHRGATAMRRLATRQAKLFSTPMPLLNHLELYSGITLTLDALDFITKSSPYLSSLTLKEDRDLPEPLRLRLRRLYLASAKLPELLARICPTSPACLPMLGSLYISDLAGALGNRDAVQCNLRVLHVAASSKGSALALFRRTTMPHLEVLALNLDSQSKVTHDEAASILKPVFICRPPLRELYLARLPLDDVDLIEALVQSPLLERLVFLDANSPRMLFNALSSPRRTSGWICSRLSHLFVEFSRCPTRERVRTSRESMVRLAQARCGVVGVMSLRHMRLNDSNLRCIDGVWFWIRNEADRPGESEYETDSETKLESDPDARAYYKTEMIEEEGNFSDTPWWQVQMRYNPFGP